MLPLRRFKPILIAVVFAFTTIAFAYVFAKNRSEERTQEQEETSTSTPRTYESIRGVQPADHVLGNPNAGIIFFVYSDFSCPYCKDYHATLKTIMKLYGSSGEVAIVFRHMPLVQLHPEAPMYALASECVAKESGNVAFWKLADLLFEKGDPLNPLNADELVILAESVGVPKQSFVACMRANELMVHVERDFQEARDSGADGSPFTVIQTNGERTAFEGAQSYRSLATMVQTLSRTRNITEGEVQSPMEGINSGTVDSDFFLFDDMASTSTSTASTTGTPQ